MGRQRFRYRRSSRRRIGIQHIHISKIFVHEAPRRDPLIENIGPHDMSTDPPIMFVLFARHMLVGALDSIYVFDFQAEVVTPSFSHLF